MKNLFFYFGIALAVQVGAQQVERCSSYGHLQDQLNTDPSLQTKMDAVETDCAQYAASYPNGYHSRSLVVIPVVFHVVYGNAGENISNTRIYEQVQVLNEDYRKQNADAANVPAVWQPLAADCEIMFCLAAVDPNGNWTDGIHRVSTSVANFNTNDHVKYTSMGGTDAWDRNVYLNIWVCDLDTNLLGYAQFPGGAAATDGVVLDYLYTGKTGALAPYNKGRSATHEIGHWLGLNHIWGDDGGSCSGSDLVADTPNQGNCTFGCYAPGTIRTDACSPSAPGYMWQNFMDYTDDACMYFFTAGQKTRMWAILNGSRLPLQTSVGCVIAGSRELTLKHELSLYPSPSDGVVTIDFGVAQPADYDISVYNALGEVIQAIHLDQYSEKTFQLNLIGEPAGIYFIEVFNGTERVVRRQVME